MTASVDGSLPAPVVVTGSAGPVGEGLVQRLGAEGVGPVVDLRGAGAAELAAAFVTGRDIVHVASDHPPDLASTRGVLGAAAGSDVRSLVCLSTAMVYGAWTNNPVPLTEEAAIRPNPGVGVAVQAAEAERLVAAWADVRPDVAVAVLRPVTVVGGGVRPPLSRAFLRASWAHPAQFLHVHDLASAIALALRSRLGGVYNVAPDGAIAPEELRALTGGIRLRTAAEIRRAPALSAYLEAPWVVANDRLRGAGWVPQHSNEEAVVAAEPPPAWALLNARRRQHLALGVAGAMVAAGVGLGIAALRRRRR